MKELSIEEKAQRYDKALEKARQLCAYPTSKPFISDLQDLFPELAESEDERIRNFLIKQANSVLDSITDDDEEVPTWKSALAWLEKQGNLMKALQISNAKIGELIEKNYYLKEQLEKQGEQKPVVKTQMVYPKFRIGDVISPNVEDGKGDYTIVGFNETLADYLVDGGNIPSCSIGIEFIDTNYHIKEHKHVEHTRNEILSELIAEKWHYLINDCKLGSVVNVKLPFNWFDWLCRWFYASGEQSVEQNSTNKIESKFKVGDWVVWDNKISCHVNNIYQGKNSLMYTITDTNDMTRSYSVKGFDNNAHLWTIQDAKDGDVLVNQRGKMPFIFKSLKENYIYCYCAYTNHKDSFFPKFINDDGTDLHWINLLHEQVYPATKEQRDTLMKAMADAGYEWDAENKQLRKIEPRQEELTEFEKAVKQVMEEAIECGDTHNLKADADMLLRLVQKSSWSEEDERLRTSCIKHIEEELERIRNDKYGHSEIISDLKESCRERINWLESLKERYTWKPSDEQMIALRQVISGCSYDIESLLELETKLKEF